MSAWTSRSLRHLSVVACLSATQNAYANDRVTVVASQRRVPSLRGLPGGPRAVLEAEYSALLKRWWTFVSYGAKRAAAKQRSRNRGEQERKEWQILQEIWRNMRGAAAFARPFARELGLSAEDTHTLVLAALAHDLGKAIDDIAELTIVQDMTDEQFDRMKGHTKIDVAFLRDPREELNGEPLLPTYEAFWGPLGWSSDPVDKILATIGGHHIYQDPSDRRSYGGVALEPVWSWTAESGEPMPASAFAGAVAIFDGAQVVLSRWRQLIGEGGSTRAYYDDGHGSTVGNNTMQVLAPHEFLAELYHFSLPGDGEGRRQYRVDFVDAFARMIERRGSLEKMSSVHSLLTRATARGNSDAWGMLDRIGTTLQDEGGWLSELVRLPPKAFHPDPRFKPSEERAEAIRRAAQANLATMGTSANDVE